MKKYLPLPVIFSLLLISFSTSAVAQSVTYPFNVKYNAGPYTTFSKGFQILREEYNPEILTEGSRTIDVNCDDISYASFNFPGTQVTYQQPRTKISGQAKISAFLKKHSTPKVIIRLPDKLMDAKFVESIELALSDLGWVILDHNLATGLNSSADIKKKTGADLILNISWLKFSDPDMFSPLEKESISIEPFSATLNTDNIYYEFEKEKNFKKWQKTKDKGLIYRLRGAFQDLDISPYRNYLIDNIAAYERFLTNKNVISAVFKLIDASNNSILGYYHVGENQPTEVSGGEKTSSYAVSKSSTFKNRKTQIKDNLLLTFLSYLDVFLPSGEIPFAAQLNEMEDVKLSDETIKESYSSSSRTSGSYSAQSRDYYNSYFNSRYYSGRGHGYSSGRSSSSTKSSGSATTTFKDAEYIRYSDFFGYYKPLTEKFVEEIRKIQVK